MQHVHKVTVMRCALILGLAFLCAGCGGRLRIGEERRVSTSKRPHWIKYTHESDGRFEKAFVGIADAPGESQAREDAIADARGQIISAVGAYGSRQIDRFVAQDGLPRTLVQPTKVTAAATEIASLSMVRTRVQAYYVESWERATVAGLVTFYKCFALVLFANSDAQGALERAAWDAIARDDDAAARQAVESALQAMGDLASKDW